jgi:Tannase-like family of unknown function (DUF6351)
MHGGTGDGAPSAVDDYALAKMDEWLTNLQKDTSSDPILTRILRAKPADLVDWCWTSAELIRPELAAAGAVDLQFVQFLDAVLSGEGLARYLSA